MFSGLSDDQLRSALEALLFVTDEPASTITLADMLEVEPSAVETALVDLRAQFQDENRGIQLREVAGGWRLFSHPAFHELIESYVLSWDTRKLSQAALETLSIIAYSQPLTRAGVSAVRGVSSDSSINSLLEKGLIKESGTAETPGNPALYCTTRTFLEKFGLQSIKELPDINSYAPDDETRNFIKERLSATRGEIPVSSELEQEAILAHDSDEREIDERIEGLSKGQASFLAQALGSQAGLVEKIDFDKLKLEEE